MFSDRLRYLEITISDWLFRAIENTEVLTLNKEYFRLRRSIDRRIYEIVRKHCGTKSRWQIGIDKLKYQVGSKQARRNFVKHLRDVQEEDHLPDYHMMLEGDKAVFSRRKGHNLKGTHKITVDSLDYVLKESVLDMGRELARQKNWDFHALKSEFCGMVEARRPDNINGAFVGFIKSKKQL